MSQSKTLSYRLLHECQNDPFVILETAGCYRVSAITGDGETDLSDPFCVCSQDFFTTQVCNTDQTATCTPPDIGPPVTTPAGTFCVTLNNPVTPAQQSAAQTFVNNEAMADANSQLVCGPPGGGSLYAYYKMDETSGNPRADAVNGNPLNEVTTPAASGVGKINNGVFFTGDSLGSVNYLATPSNAGFNFSGDFSISFWVFPPSGVNASEPVLRIAGLAVSGAGNNPGTMRIRSEVLNPGFTPLPFFLLVRDTWHHLSFTWNAASGEARWYADNALQSATAGLGSLDTTPFGLSVGGNTGEGTNNDSFEGGIDELGFWTKVLSPAEISTLFNGGAGLPFGSPGFPN